MMKRVERDISGIYVLWLREVKRFKRATSRVLSSIFQPIFWFITFGFGFGGAVKFSTISSDYMSFLAPSILVMTVFSTSLMGGISVIWDREFGFLREILVAPVSRTAISIGRTLGVSTTAVIQGTLVLMIELFIVRINLSLASVISTFGVMFLIAFISSALGVLIASMMKSTEGFGLIMTFINFPLIALGGVFFPVSQLPGFLRVLSFVDPLTYGTDLIRYVMMGFSELPPLLDLTSLLLYSITTIGLSSYMFRRTTVES
ncbi:MAG: ABC transporter permease [Candidatus Asgardarchaeia archaeon]